MRPAAAQSRWTFLLLAAMASLMPMRGVAAEAAGDSTSSHADSAAAYAARPFLPLTYADSLTSVNTHCIVSGSHLNPRIDPVYVNGQPVGFC